MGKQDNFNEIPDDKMVTMTFWVPASYKRDFNMAMKMIEFKTKRRMKQKDVFIKAMSDIIKQSCIMTS